MKIRLYITKLGGRAKKLLLPLVGAMVISSCVPGVSDKFFMAIEKAVDPEGHERLQVIRTIGSDRATSRDFIRECNLVLNGDTPYKSRYDIIPSDPKKLKELCEIVKKRQGDDDWE